MLPIFSPSAPDLVRKRAFNKSHLGILYIFEMGKVYGHLTETDANFICIPVTQEPKTPTNCFNWVVFFIISISLTEPKLTNGWPLIMSCVSAFFFGGGSSPFSDSHSSLTTWQRALQSNIAPNANISNIIAGWQDSNECLAFIDIPYPT